MIDSYSLSEKERLLLDRLEDELSSSFDANIPKNELLLILDFSDYFLAQDLYWFVCRNYRACSRNMEIYMKPDHFSVFLNWYAWNFRVKFIRKHTL